MTDPTTAWTRVALPWYDGAAPTRLLQRGGLVVSRGQTPATVALGTDARSRGVYEPKAYRYTDPSQEPARISADYTKRWPLEVTIEESRAHLGIETQRQWSDLAIERNTPALLGLYSLVALFAQALHPDGKIPVARAAWYAKEQATFSDVLLEVRPGLWHNLIIRHVPMTHICKKCPRRS